MLPTVATSSWSPLGSENINTSVVNSPDALVEGLGDGHKIMVPNVRDAMLVKGGNPEPVMVTTCPGSADCGSTVMDAGTADAEGGVTVGIGIGASAVGIVGDVGVGSTVGTSGDVGVGSTVGTSGGVGVGSTVGTSGGVGVASTVGTEGGIKVAVSTEAGIVVGGAVGRLVTGETSVGIDSGVGEDAGVTVPSSASFSATPSSFSAAISRISWPLPPQERLRRVKNTNVRDKSCTRLEVGIKGKPP